jgi:outer membrane biosynthesis protein TonB
VDSQSFVGEKHLASSRNLGLAISFAIHVFLGSSFVALNTVTIEQADFESLEVQSLEVNTLSTDELQAIIALLELDPEVSEEGTNLSVIPVNEKAASATLIGAKSNSDSSPVELPQVTEEKEIPEPKPEPKPEPPAENKTNNTVDPKNESKHIEKRVKEIGGNYDTSLRITLLWDNCNDLDLKLIEPD